MARLPGIREKIDRAILAIQPGDSLTLDQLAHAIGEDADSVVTFVVSMLGEDKNWTLDRVGKTTTIRRKVKREQA